MIAVDGVLVTCSMTTLLTQCIVLCGVVPQEAIACSL